MVGTLRRKARRGAGLKVWRQGGRGNWVALVAAYMLLAQSLVSAFALGASASPGFADTLGTVLCAPSGEQLPAGKDGPAKPHLPDCCLTGCSLFGQALLPAVYGASLLVPVVLAASSATAPEARAPDTDRRGRPANPRAPPRSV